MSGHRAPSLPIELWAMSSRRPRDGKGRTVFVTVGTTKFEKLVRLFDSEDVLRQMERLGVRKITVQTGRGVHVPFQNIPRDLKDSMELEHFGLKPSIGEYIDAADLIVGHAGVGTIVETLRADKPLLVVVNQDLMDNHQQEVATALASKGYINMAYPETLLETLKTKQVFAVAKYPPVNYDAFPSVVDDEMDFC